VSQGKEDKSLLVVHYIQGHRLHLWTCEQVQFEGEQEPSVWDTWCHTLKDALQKQSNESYMLF
jgi:hypothetical protein